MTKLIPVILFSLLVPLGLSAEEKAPSVSVTLRSLGIGTSLPKVFVRGGQATKVTELSVKSFSLGNPVHYSGLAELSFYVGETPDEFIEEEATSETTAAPQKKLYSGVVGDKKKPVKVATVSLPGRAANYLLIWSRLGPDRYAVIAMPDDPVSQPVDSLRFVNLTRAPLVMQIKEGAVLQLKPGDAQVLETQGREVFPFKALAVNPDGVHELLSNVVETRKGLRRTVLLLVSKAAEVGGSPAQDPIFTFYTFTNPVDVVPTPPK